MSKYHSLDTTVVSKRVLYVNEPELLDRTIIDRSLQDDTVYQDNIRVYIPLDINTEAILRRIQSIYKRYGNPSWKNESNYISEISGIIHQLEIYDEVWMERQGNFGNGHSKNATMLVDEIIKILEENEGCAELFPYETINQLKMEYKF